MGGRLSGGSHVGVQLWGHNMCMAQLLHVLRWQHPKLDVDNVSHHISLAVLLLHGGGRGWAGLGKVRLGWVTILEFFLFLFLWIIQGSPYSIFSGPACPRLIDEMSLGDVSIFLLLLSLCSWFLTFIASLSLFSFFSQSCCVDVNDWLGWFAWKNLYFLLFLLMRFTSGFLALLSFFSIFVSRTNGLGEV